MPLKHELLEKHRNQKAREMMRAHQEGQIISALPDDLQVRRAYTTIEQANNRKIAAAHGVWEFEVREYEDLGTLLARPELTPVEVLCVSMFEGTFKSTSFYPVARIPSKWWEREDVELILSESFVWQASPLGLSVERRADVVVEWFCEPRTGMFVNVRARILKHNCGYYMDRLRPGGALLANAPSGNVRKSALNGPGYPYITVWWYDTAFSEDYTFLDMLTERRALQDA